MMKPDYNPELSALRGARFSGAAGKRRFELTCDDRFCGVRFSVLA
jgi:hypothetical protein